MAPDSKANGQDFADSNGNNVNSATSKHNSKISRLKSHFARFWWLHLINVIVAAALLVCLLLFVGFPNIAQSAVDGSKLTIVSQTISNPTPESVTIAMVAQAHIGTSFKPALDSFVGVLFLEDTEPNIKPFGNVTIPEIKVRKNVDLSVKQNMIIQDQEQFTNYNILVTQSEKYRVAMRGATMLRLSGLPAIKVNFNKVFELEGLNNLKGLSVSDIKLNLTALPGQPNLRGTANIQNPTPMTLTLGTIVQDLFVDNIFIGNTTIEDIILKPGMNSFQMSATSDQAAVISLITTKYKSGVIPVVAKSRSVVYNNQHLPYFEEALRRSPVPIDLDLAPTLATIGINITAITGPGGGAASPSSAVPPKSLKSMGLEK